MTAQPWFMVPTHHDTLLLPQEQPVVAATADFAKLPYFNGSHDVNSATAYLSETILARPFQNRNLYLPAGARPTAYGHRRAGVYDPAHYVWHDHRRGARAAAAAAVSDDCASIGGVRVVCTQSFVILSGALAKRRISSLRRREMLRFAQHDNLGRIRY